MKLEVRVEHHEISSPPSSDRKKRAPKARRAGTDTWTATHSDAKQILLEIGPVSGQWNDRTLADCETVASTVLKIHNNKEGVGGSCHQPESGIIGAYFVDAPHAMECIGALEKAGHTIESRDQVIQEITSPQHTLSTAQSHRQGRRSR